MDNKLKHLEFVQAIINRLANFVQMKVWRVLSSVLPWLVIVSGACLSIWLAWGQDTLPAIILGLTVASLAFHGARAPLYSVRERNEAEARNKRAELCEEPVRKIFDLLDKMLASEGKVSDREVLKSVKIIRKLLIVKADAELLIAWDRFNEAIGHNRSEIEVIKASEDLFRALRKSIGHDDRELPFGFVTAIYLKPEDKHKAMTAGSSSKRS